MSSRKIGIHAGFLFYVLLSLGNSIRAADPGLDLPSTAEASAHKLGSVLIFPFYISSAASPASTNTLFALTNENSVASAYVQLIFVHNTGVVEPNFICLTPNQTATFKAHEVSPGTKGYIVAVAVDLQGKPTNFNFISGEASVKLANGQLAAVSPLCIAAINLPVFSGPTATLNFDGVAYNRLPRTLAAEQLKSTSDGNNTSLVVTRVGGNLAVANGGALLGSIFGNINNQAGVAFPFTATSSGTQLFSQLSSNFPNVTPTFDQILPAGGVGWMHVAADGDFGIVGALLNFNPNTATQSRAHTGGHSLRPLTLTSAASLTIAITPPPC